MWSILVVVSGFSACVGLVDSTFVSLCVASYK